MKIWHEELPFKPESEIISDYFTEDSLFFDIETTGFSPKTTSLYLIGCASRIGNTLHIHQFFAENRQSEKEVLVSFLKFSSAFRQIITFNGIGFDIPYLKEKCKTYHIDDTFDNFEYLDIFKKLHGYKQILRTENMKQKSIEKFLGISREDLYSGGELIEVYHSYVKTPSDEALNLLRLHNFCDVRDMIPLLEALSYPSFFQGKYSVSGMQINDYTAFDGTKGKELLVKLNPYYPLPKRITLSNKELYLSGTGHLVQLSIRLFEGELKFFFPDYKNYYYLPAEDTAMHKSVASYVDKEFRKQAKAENCYTKKAGLFLPQYQEFFQPAFRKSYKDKLSYLEWKEEYLSLPDNFKKYIYSLTASLTKSSVRS